jgi:hypothetical protein
VTIDAWSNHITSGNAKAKAGGFAADVRAYMTSILSYDTQAYLDDGAKIATTGHVGITSDAMPTPWFIPMPMTRFRRAAMPNRYGHPGRQPEPRTLRKARRNREHRGPRATTSNMDVHGDAEGYGAALSAYRMILPVDISENKVLLESGSTSRAIAASTDHFNNVDTRLLQVASPAYSAMSTPTETTLRH